MSASIVIRFGLSLATVRNRVPALLVRAIPGFTIPSRITGQIFCDFLQTRSKITRQERQNVV